MPKVSQVKGEATKLSAKQLTLEHIPLFRSQAMPYCQKTGSWLENIEVEQPSLNAEAQSHPPKVEKDDDNKAFELPYLPVVKDETSETVEPLSLIHI